MGWFLSMGLSKGISYKKLQNYAIMFVNWQITSSSIDVQNYPENNFVKLKYYKILSKKEKN